MLQSGPALSSGSAARADSSQATPQQAQVRGDAQAQRELRGAGGKTAMLRMR
jgi:hypothetical protein